MKKFWGLCCTILLLATGCGKVTGEDVVKEFSNQVNDTKSYVLKGTMEIYSDEDTFTYSVEANYLKDNFYKVLLVNQTNNHEQIILRNNDGVYVITPSLNKSFKFQSEWPDNSSQSYLLKAIASDINNDAEVSMEEVDSKYVVKSKVNYPNNSELVYQKVTLDKNMKLEKVEVYNANDAVKIKMNVGSIDMKASLNEDDFKLEDYIKKADNESTTPSKSNSEECDSDKETCNTKKSETEIKCDENDASCKKENSGECKGNSCTTKDKTTGVLEDIIYPLYIPSNTYLSGKDKVDTDVGERVILTFGGEKSFVLVEEVAVASNEFEIIPVYGEPYMLNDTIAALSDNSLYWTSNDVSYYLAGNDLSSEEILNIAKNMNTGTSVVNGNVSNEK